MGWGKTQRGGLANQRLEHVCCFGTLTLPSHNGAVCSRDWFLITHLSCGMQELQVLSNIYGDKPQAFPASLVGPLCLCHCFSFNILQHLGLPSHSAEVNEASHNLKSQWRSRRGANHKWRLNQAWVFLSLQGETWMRWNPHFISAAWAYISFAPSIILYQTTSAHFALFTLGLSPFPSTEPDSTDHKCEFPICVFYQIRSTSHAYYCQDMKERTSHSSQRKEEDQLKASQLCQCIILNGLHLFHTFLVMTTQSTSQHNVACSHSPTQWHTGDKMPCRLQMRKTAVVWNEWFFMKVMGEDHSEKLLVIAFSS